MQNARGFIRVGCGQPRLKAVGKGNALLCLACCAACAAGFSGAELANVVNEAALLAGRQAKNAVEVGELVEGVQRTKCALVAPCSSATYQIVVDLSDSFDCWTGSRMKGLCRRRSPLPLRHASLDRNDRSLGSSAADSALALACSPPEPGLGPTDLAFIPATVAVPVALRRASTPAM